jgi:DNA polymerase
MRSRDIVRYCRELGWHDAPDLPEPVPKTDVAPETTATAATKTAAAPEADAATAASAAACSTLEQLARFLDGCTRCRLSEKRRTVVFGEGDPAASVMFIGEGPGAEEDRTGRPFVGQAGRLLDQMVFALGFSRTEVYIGNVVKCRPPSNRDPEADEMAACSEFLDRQIELIGPRVIVALGRVAARRLTGSEKPMGALRGRWASYRGIPLLPIFHPAYLLRNQIAKRQTWDDLKLVKEKLASTLSS